MYAYPGNAKIRRSNITNGQATNGIIYVSGFTSDIMIDDCTFDKNKAMQDSSILFAMTNQKGKIVI